tara:strand:- start:1929 stop:2606 length:678 start_codon:yes stop_codon:yes gene_type:complete
MALSKIDVANMLTGEVPNANVATIGVAKGGTGLTSGTSGQFLKFTGSTTVASSAVSGIDVADHFRLTASTSAGTAGRIGSSSGAGGTFAKLTNMFSDTGSVTTGSDGGKFSFPKTGIYHVVVSMSGYNDTTDNDWSWSFETTTNNFSSSTEFGYVRCSVQAASSSTPNNYIQSTGSLFMDVTDVSNVKFMLNTGSIASGNYFYGSSSGADGKISSQVMITRLADT